MITYVNTVLVSNAANPSVISDLSSLEQNTNTPSAQKGSIVILPLDDNAESNTIDENTDKIKIGIVQGINTPVVYKNGVVKYMPNIKWSNEIKKHDIKSYRKLEYHADTEDQIKIDFANMEAGVANAFALGGKHIFLRLTFKDLPTRYRNWTETYDYVTMPGDGAAQIASALALAVNKATKRARVVATAQGTAVIFEAMPYDDDNAADTINWAAKGRFNANVYFKDPAAPAFASSNKYEILGATIEKIPGKWYAASAKLVRDRESTALGYQGILNQGPGTWPIIRPALEADITAQYDGLTLEFENMYRAADDIFRKTKQTVEIYVPTGKLTAIENALKPFVGDPSTELNDTNSGAAYVEPAVASGAGDTF